MHHLLEVNDLTTIFDGDSGRATGTDHVSFHVDKNEVVCIVGESGCGKSVTSLSIMGLLGKDGTVTSGSVLFDGRNLLNLSEKEMDKIRGNEMTMIFQDPLTSLNPVFTIGNQIIESMRTHRKISRGEARGHAEEILKKVGLSDVKKVMKKYPYMLSGGMRQRVMIAMAICCNPLLLIADEPTTALDMTIQAQIMELLRSLQKEKGMAMILITHDMGLVAQMADRVLVMYAGQIVEEAAATDLFQNPKHPYTQALLKTVPTIYDQEDRKLEPIPGIVPEHYGESKECRFAERCAYCKEACKKQQEFYKVGSGHWVRCIRTKISENQDTER